ncbi:MAG: RNA-directed DNA polymerase [Candidatus Gracilibacteria bacterium]|nr:RNA-directed DNA polymerase [Candidatus Gracilibacteria bacterium]
MELSELFEAYYECRRHKRKTVNALAFELDYESNLIALYEEVKNRTYSVGKSIAFIVDKPVKREIFAGDFRDRVIHHSIIRKLNPLFEKLFIHDSYSCREGKGTLFGIKRVDTFIRGASENYTRDAYILKLDIEGFFMNIDRSVLLTQIRKVIDTKYVGDDKEELFWLCQKVVRNDPTTNCIIKGRREDWVGLPRSKSLFFARPGVGLPIGNLTSQVFANLYLHDLDIFIKKKLKIRHYGRYVDDFILIHEDGRYLKGLIGEIRSFLSEHLGLSLHPNKIYFQPFSKGVSFLGALIKPHRIYVGKRIKTNLFVEIERINRMIVEDTKVLHDREIQKHILSSLNSYLGLMQHFDTFTIRKKLLLGLDASFWNYFYISERYRLIVAKTRELSQMDWQNIL